MQKKLLIRLLYTVIVVLLLTDLAYSFLQYHAQPLDGDMPSLLVPASDVQPIFDDPTGITAIINDKTYLNPNRFFCHWMYKEYMTRVPLLLQHFVPPVESVYLASAIAKTLIQILILFLLSAAISGSANITRIKFVAAALIIAPLFQANGYRSSMGIIDPAPTYTFFYALPCALMLWYFLPFIREFYYHKKISGNWLIFILWIPFALVVSLHGALNPGIALTVSLLLFCEIIIRKFRQTGSGTFIDRFFTAVSELPRNYWFFLIPVSFFSIYSLFLGRYNAYSIQQQIPLLEMYKRLPEGIFNILTQKPGYPVLLLLLALNSVIIHRYHYDPEGRQILKIFRWAGIFALVYILLLPLGGYREYRYYIVRYDTIMPVTLTLLFMFGKTSLFLLSAMKAKQKKLYLPLLICCLLVFANADKPGFDKNKCEKQALEQIASSPEPVVRIDSECNVVSWEKITDPVESGPVSLLLQKWKIINNPKLFYQTSFVSTVP